VKKSILFTLVFLVLFLGNAHAVFNSGSTGADGPFNPAADTELQLPPDGVFNFTTVNIPSGVTVTFMKNSTNTPVYILATGDVVIDGTISLSGTSYASSPGQGGPGGYDGGQAGDVGIPAGDGLGPGGGQGGSVSEDSCCGPWRGGGGGHATPGGSPVSGVAGGAAYGDQKLVPLIGGSGGGGSSTVPGRSDNYGGGGGGGAILIASSGSITVTGSIGANGGTGKCYAHYGQGGQSGGGGGGAIRLIANSINGNGVLSAKGNQTSCYNNGGDGRIRLETYTNYFSSNSTPPYSLDQPGSVFPVGLPSLIITSVGGVNAPASPTGSYATPDITFPSSTVNPVTVVISGSNIPVGTTVTVTVVPQYGASFSGTGLLSGTEESSSTSVDVDLSIDHPNIIKAEATFTQSTAMYWDGEKIEKVKVASTIGKESEILYITEKGNAIRAEELILAGVLRK
jgi:hypothetical protein